MDIKIWFQERKKEIALAKRYFLPILKNSVTSSISWCAGALGIVFIATIIDIGITYILEGAIDMDKFFPPYFFLGVLIVFILIFLYQVIVETSTEINKYVITADKYTWKGVNFEVIENKMFGIGLHIHTDNLPPYIIDGIYGVIGSLTKGRNTIHLNIKDPISQHTDGVLELPYTMDSSVGQTFRYGQMHLVKGSELVLAVADWDDRSAWINVREKGEERTLDLVSNEEYKIVIVLQGKMQSGLDLGRCALTYLMTYEGKNSNKKVTLKEVSKDFLK